MRTVTITVTGSTPTGKTSRGRWIVVVFRLEGVNMTGRRKRKANKTNKAKKVEEMKMKKVNRNIPCLDLTAASVAKVRWIKGGGKTAKGRRG